MIIELRLHELTNTTVVPLVRIPQVLADPGFDVCDLGQRVLGRSLAGVESGKSCAEAELVNITVLDNVVVSLGERRVDEELQESLAGDGPATLGVALDELLAVAECAS